MLFRPNFCANCGDKVERPEWFPWTSRRFCIVCETEFMGSEMIPRVVVTLALVIGVFGIGSYLNSGASVSDIQAVKQPRKISEQPAVMPKAVANVVPAAQVSANPDVNGQPEVRKFSSAQADRSVQQDRAKPEPRESVSFCGAETKKGTPCSRRVKRNTRCYQHIGMPAMADTDDRIIRSQK